MLTNPELAPLPVTMVLMPGLSNPMPPNPVCCETYSASQPPPSEWPVTKMSEVL